MPSSSQKLFENGTEVMAKWPNSSLYFKGKIIDHNDIEYLVRFYDEGKSEYPVKYKNVQLPFPSRGTRSRSRGRSPGRTKSPSRNSPGRKSPARKPSTRKSSPKKTPVSSTATEITSLSLRRSTRAATEKVTSDISRRQSARLADKSTEKTKGALQFKFISEKIKKNVIPFMRRLCFGTWMTVSSLVLPAVILLSPFILSLMCSAKSCSFSRVEFPQKLSSYYDQKAVLYSAVFTLSLAVLSLLPVGKVVSLKGNNEVRCNGYISLILLTIVMVVALRMQYNLSPIYLLFRHFLVTFAAFGVLLSLLVYIKSFFVPKSSLFSKGNTGYYVVDFIKGRELNPRIGGRFDIKFFLYRLTVFLIAALNFLIVAKDLQTKSGQYSPTLLVCCGLQIFLSLDLIVFEDSFLSSFDYLKQGTGFTTIVGYLSIPFLLTIYSRYILNHGSELPWYFLLGISALFLVGYTIFRGSMSQKHAFRVNPNNPALVHLESLSASGGKRLLVSGWFGLVRHPEVLGGILIDLSFPLLCGFKFCVPHIAAFLLISCNIAMMFLNEKASKHEFGLAWNNYVSRVPHRLIPKVF